VKHPARQTTALIAGCVILMLGSGCITITPPSPSSAWKSLTKPKVHQASYEEKVPAAPSDPKNPARLKVAYGRLMEETGQLAEARKSYAEAVELQPKEVEALIGLARLDQEMGHLDQAEQGYKKAVKVVPTSSRAHYSLGQFYASQERWEEAREALTKAMLAEPDETQARYALAVALVHTGKVDAALPHFIRTVGDAEAHYNVGLILQQQGNLQDAERHFALAVSKKPELVAAQNWLAHVRQQQSETPEPSENLPVHDDSQVLPAGHRTFSGREAPTPRTSPVTNSFSAPQSPSPNPIPQRNVTAQQIEQNQNQNSHFGS